MMLCVIIPCCRVGWKMNSCLLLGTLMGKRHKITEIRPVFSPSKFDAISFTPAKTITYKCSLKEFQS